MKSRVLELIKALNAAEYEQEAKRSNMQRLHYEEEKAKVELETAQLQQRMMIKLAQKEGISLIDLKTYMGEDVDRD